MRNIICITPVKHLKGVYQKLESFGNIVYEPDITKDNLRKLLADHSITELFTNPNKQTFVLDESVLELSNIQLINTCSTGTNHIDMEYCERKGITVYSLTTDFDLLNDLPSTAEMAFSLMTALLKKIPQGFESVKKFEWDYTKHMGRQLHGLSVGVVGYGRLGKMFSKFAQSFGMDVSIYDPYIFTPETVYFNSRYSNLQEMIEVVDILSLHVHVTNETKGFINKSSLKNLRNDACIINTARGAVVNEMDIVDMLASNKLAGYATDVLNDEYYDIRRSPIIKAANDGLNIVISPHVAGMTWEGQRKAYLYAIDKFKRSQK